MFAGRFFVSAYGNASRLQTPKDNDKISLISIRHGYHGRNHSGQRYSNKVIDFVLPHYNKGDYYYKIGEWDKAENEWLMILKLMGHFPTLKLAIMYRKQKRFSDEVELLKFSQIYARKNTVYPGTKTINERIPKAEKFREKHINEDKSKGIDKNKIIQKII